jgi:MFS family permease
MCVMRALCGIGGGIMVPNIIALIGINFPPGPRRNLGFALFGAMAPVGAAGGSLVSAVIVQLSHWKWLFFML